MNQTVDYDEWRAQQIQDPEFVSELEKLEPGYQVARLRTKLGLTQSQLAEIVGTKQPSIARLENGEGSPSLTFLKKVAEALGAEVKVRLVPRNTAQSVRENSESTEYKLE